jgi:hypothetical protein
MYQRDETGRGPFQHHTMLRLLLPHVPREQIRTLSYPSMPCTELRRQLKKVSNGHHACDSSKHQRILILMDIGDLVNTFQLHKLYLGKHFS